MVTKIFIHLLQASSIRCLLKLEVKKFYFLDGEQRMLLKRFGKFNQKQKERKLEATKILDRNKGEAIKLSK